MENSNNSIVSKTILSKSKIPGMDYVLNPYVGCSHNCIYCYAKNMKKDYDEIKWSKDICYKENAVSLLEREVSKIKENERVMLASVTDIYQDIEIEMNLTRELLKVLAKNNINVSILTKSDLVVRDLDILKQFKNIEVGLSIACANEIYLKTTEPGTNDFCKRIDALKILHDNNIKSYVFVSPTIPYITKLEDIIINVSSYVDYIMGEVINLKMTNIAKFKLELLKLFSLDKVEKIVNTCSDTNYLFGVRNEFNRLCSINNINNKGFFLHNLKK